MNIKHALQVPISLVLERMGSTLIKQNGNEEWYLSPLRKEKTASLHVHTLKNVWYDFGENIGGDVVKLVCTYLEHCRVDHQVADALRWLNNMTISYKPVQFDIERKKIKNQSKLELKHSTKLGNVKLLHYLESRGIPPMIATRYVKEVLVKNKETNKQFSAIGFRNEDLGWELRNELFKGCIAPKTITFVRGEKPKPDIVNIFEGFMDFLSIASLNEKGFVDGDSIVLNSLSCLSQAFPFIKDYGYTTLCTWLDNDHAGRKAIETVSAFVKTQIGLTHVSMNDHYAPHKDVNAWLMCNLGLK